MKIILSNFISYWSQVLGLEEILFLSGMTLMYLGLSVQFNHAIAQIVSGAVLICVSMLILFKGAA